MMIKLLLVTLLCGVAYAGYASTHGYGYSYSGGDLGGHGNHGWYRPGWANVNFHQNAHSYKYGLNEKGKDYEKYVNVQGDTHHSEPIHHGWGQ